MSDDRGPIINAGDEWAVSDRRAPALPPETRESDRFGDRLRETLKRRPPGMGDEYVKELFTLAAAIDQDAEDQRLRLMHLCAEEEARRSGGIRRQIEEAVERLKYSVASWQEAEEGDLAIAGQRRDIVDAVTFVAELDRIFGERTSGFVGISSDRKDAVAAWMNAHRPLAEIMMAEGSPLSGRTCPSIEEIVDAAIAEITDARRILGDRRARILALVEAEKREREADAGEAAPEPPSAQIVDLMAALKASLEQKP